MLSSDGFTSTRTAGSELPPHEHLSDAAYLRKLLLQDGGSRVVHFARLVSVAEVSPSIRIGASAGFTFRHVGLCGRLAGSWPRAALMAACTSRAAASMLRFRSNCSVMLVEPSVLEEVISFSPAMRPNWRSSGVATEDAIVSGLAPGKRGDTEIDGKSTCGSGATGRNVIRRRAGQAERHSQQRRGDRPLDERRRETHEIGTQSFYRSERPKCMVQISGWTTPLPAKRLLSAANRS